MQFSTTDADNDANVGNCAQIFHGAWWHNACGSSLNGIYLGGSQTSYADGVNWKSWRGYYYSHKIAMMKIATVS